MDAVTFQNSPRQSLAPPAIPRFSRHLRVSIVSDAIHGRNGVGTYYPDLVQHLEPHVDRVQLIAPQEERDPHLEWLSLPMPGDKTQRMAWPNTYRLFNQLDGFEPSVVVIPSLGAFSYYAMRYAKDRGIPFAIVNHTNFDHLLSLYWPHCISYPLRRGLRTLNRWLCRQASGVAAMNADAFEEASDAGSQFVRVMGTPLSFEFLNTPLSPLKSQIERVIFVGRLAEEKGLTDILQSAQQLPHIHFAIAGDGPLRKQVEDSAKENSNVEYLGWIDRSRVLAEIDDSQLLLLPSIFETFGTVALEALARRRFVLASRNCGIAKWPSLAAGILYIEKGESVTQALQRTIHWSASKRESIARTSWDSVRIFNDHTIRTWLKFLCDAAQATSMTRQQASSPACRLERKARPK
jgi:glycosyltransferase involved in cell wall biosynthesis